MMKLKYKGIVATAFRPWSGKKVDRL